MTRYRREEEGDGREGRGIEEEGRGVSRGEGRAWERQNVENRERRAREGA